jgi:hypothetical protein
MGALQDMRSGQGFSGHELAVLLVRLMFCLLAEDTGTFESAAFRASRKSRTADKGRDLGSSLNVLIRTDRDT